MLSSRVRSAGVRALTSFRRSQSTASGIWSDFSKRSPSLAVLNPDIKLLHEINPKEGPASIENLERKLAYHSPVDIDDTFALAYEFLQKESLAKYNEIETLKAQEQTKDVKDRIDELLVEAEKFNPEVLYNAEHFGSHNLDKSQPVYRQLLKEKWQALDLMVLMQRLEQLAVIPDTLPTLVPEVDVKVKFPHNTKSEFSSWVTPGEILPAFAVAKPPTILIQEFDRVDKDQLYTVLIVNPDTPDLPSNSFSTSLQYGLANVPLNNVNNTIDTKLLLKYGDSYTFKEYSPLVPEKNAQNQRACLWVFRQSSPLEITEVGEEMFDIRDFAEKHSLNPVGAHVWRQHFDRSVNEVRTEYGMGKGRVFHRVREVQPVTK